MSSPYPAVDALAVKSSRARSVASGVIEMAAEGRLGELARDFARMRGDVDSGGVALVKSGDGRVGAAGRRQLLAEAGRLDGIASELAGAGDREGADSYREAAKAARTRAGSA